MSGIAGIMPLDGSSPTASQIEAIAACLERRGPDGTHVMVLGQVALGHTLLATTPEALVEVLPLTDGPTGCTVTADARLDNRDELLTALDLAKETRTIGDGELILRAYLLWGEECATHLLGDFAFAIWDPRSARLLCARDPIGMRQLIYHHDAGRRFIFATEPNAILALPDVDALLNHDRVGDYLSNMEGADLCSTFFRDITRLPPAHILTVDRDGLKVRRYWELAPEPILNLPTDEAYAAAFLALFTEAVRCRLRSAGSIGAMVSGGIDSNAVAAVAARLLASESRGPLPTFSAIGPDASECPETRAILTAIQSPSFAPTTVNYAALEPFHADLTRAMAESAEPFDGDMTLLRAIYLAARRAGTNIVLDGAGSDLLLSSDFHLAFLLREGRVRHVVREARGERRFWGPEAPAWRGMLAAAWQAFVPTAVRAIRFARGRRKADRHFLDRAAAVAPFLDPIRALDRRRQVQRLDFEHDRVDSLTRVRTLTHRNLVAGRERYDRVASACGVEPRDPFLDLRLIRFCLSLPRDQLQRGGWPKWILRQAMERTVPADIVWRRGKEHIGPEFTRVVIAEPSQSRPDDVHAAGNLPLTERYESIYLSNWFVYMLRHGWTSGTVKREGFEDDDR